jgi:hypothetical protein
MRQRARVAVGEATLTPVSRPAAIHARTASAVTPYFLPTSAGVISRVVADIDKPSFALITNQASGATKPQGNLLGKFAANSVKTQIAIS